MSGIIDTHCHIYEPEFDEDRDKLIREAKESGIEKLLLPNIDDESIERLFSTCEAYPEYVVPMMGFHPTSVDENYVVKLKEVEKALNKTNYCAIGEIGIDLYWDKTWKKEQQEVFKEQLLWSIDMNLPIAIHMREAFDEVMESISKVGSEKLKGVFHSFTGNSEQLREIEKLKNFYIGINGVVTFKKSTLSDELKGISLDRLLLETDAPYLSPTPYRGKRNEPTYIWKTAEKLSQTYDVSIQDVVERTRINAIKLFKNI